MTDVDKSATPDQLRAAEKRRKAADAAQAAAKASREQLDERAAPPKGRSSTQSTEA